MRTRLWIAGLCAAVATGCNCGNNGGSDGGTDSGAPVDSGNPGMDAGTDAGGGADSGTDAGVDAGPPQTITATRIFHFQTESGLVNVGQNFTVFANIGVWVADPAADGGYDFYPGSGDDAGNATVPNVPGNVTTYYFAFGATYVQGLTPTLDLDQNAAGRPNVGTVDAGIQYTLSGLQPWNTFEDQLLLVSGNADHLTAPSLRDGGGQLIQVGGTTYANTDYARDPRAIDSSQGDKTILYQLSTQVGIDGGTPVVLGASTSFASTTFSEVDGMTTLLDAGMTALPQLPAIWTFDGAAWDAYGAALNPNAVAGHQDWGIRAAFSSVNPQLLLMDVAPSVPSSTTLSGTYGNPFKAAPWGMFAYAEETWQLFEKIGTIDGGTLPDGGLVTDVENLLAQYVDGVATFPPADGGTISPNLSPPVALSLDGAAADGPGMLASTTPVLSWVAPGTFPAQYTPFYFVTISRLYARPNGTLVRQNFTIITQDTGFQVFPGMLLPGGAQYVFRVEALARVNGIAIPLIGGGGASYISQNATGVWTTP
jgi:hypothetical protein